MTDKVSFKTDILSFLFVSIVKITTITAEHHIWQSLEKMNG